MPTDDVVILDVDESTIESPYCDDLLSLPGEVSHVSTSPPVIHSSPLLASLPPLSSPLLPSPPPLSSPLLPSPPLCTMSFLCHTSQLRDFSLSHLGSLEAANLPPYSCLEEEDATQTLASLQSVVFKSKGNSTYPKHSGSHEEGAEEPMLVVAMEMRLDKLRNSKVD